MTHPDATDSAPGLFSRIRRRWRNDLPETARIQHRTPWSMEAVERALGRQLGEAARNADLSMAAIAMFRRVAKSLPPGVHVHYDGTVYAPAALDTNAELLVSRAMENELILRVAEVRSACLKAGPPESGAEALPPPRATSAAVRRANRGQHVVQS